jgi:hypothetical protein
MNVCRHAFLVLLVLLLSLQAPLAAEYNGTDLDGETYDATAYSYSTAKYYSVEVEFSGDEATIYFTGGNHIALTLDDEEIDDPHNISAYDYQHAVYWDLDVDGID